MDGLTLILLEIWCATIIFWSGGSDRKTLFQNVFISAGTNWAFFWRIRVLRLCERSSSVAGNVVNVGLGSLPQVDFENSNGFDCSHGFRDQACCSFPIVQDKVSKREI